MALLVQREGCDACGFPEAEVFGEHLLCRSCVACVQTDRAPKTVMTLRCSICGGDGCDRCKGSGRRPVTFSREDYPDSRDLLEDTKDYYREVTR